MSGLACILDRRRQPISRRRLWRLGEGLADFGEASSDLVDGPVGIVVRHRGDPGSRNRFGPLRDDSSGTAVAVAGRFGLIEGRRRPGASAVGDPDEIGCARWTLERWIDDGLGFLDEIAGSFTIVVADPATARLTVVRDHLGDLKVYHHADSRRFVAASTPDSILTDNAVAAEPDPQSVARFLGFRFDHTERSFYRGIRELAPGSLVTAGADDLRQQTYWNLPNSPRMLADDEVDGAVVDHLTRAVRHHTTGLPAQEIALSLSGGLDSTALAALAPAGIRAYSWVFETAPQPREQSNIEAAAARLGLPLRLVNGDRRTPLSDAFIERYVHPGSPYVNPFAGLKQHLYACALEDGCRRVVVGDGGDVIYGGWSYWLRDALAGGRWWALPSFGRTVGRALRGDRGSWGALRRLLPARRIRPRRTPRWLTREAGLLLPDDQLSPILPGGAVGRRFDLSVGARNIELESEERRLFHRCGIERANPFWHRPLLEVALRIPAYHLHRDGVDKVLVRRAFRDRLPPEVLASDRVGLLGDLFLRGIDEHRKLVEELVFRRPFSDWRRYVSRDWLYPHLESTDTLIFGHTILWRTISYELWVRRVWGDPSERVLRLS